MKKVTALQMTNILDVRVMWLTVPERNVYPNLSYWRKHFELGGRETGLATAPSCNTIACFGGWCAWWPAFMAQGVRAGLNGSPSIPRRMDSSPVLFGHHKMFAPRGCLHKEGGRKNDDKSDWQIVMDRINWMIANSEVAA